MDHLPVLRDEVFHALQISSGETCCDCTLGLGGHAADFLRASSPGGVLIGIDADEDNLSAARTHLSVFGARVKFVHGNFRDLPTILSDHVDVIFADLGVSSPHFDDPARGFSFRADGPLDLRFDRSSGQTAAEWIEQSSSHTIALALSQYGELRGAMRCAELLKEDLPKSTMSLLRTLERVYHWKARGLAPQVFQALRIAVNDEMGALDRLLVSAPRFLRPQGRLAMITFHSLEDRRVKHAFRALTTPGKDEQTGNVIAPSSFELVSKRPVCASTVEIHSNPRARSAKLRCIRRVL